MCLSCLFLFLWYMILRAGVTLFGVKSGSRISSRLKLPKCKNSVQDVVELSSNSVAGEKDKERNEYWNDAGAEFQNPIMISGTTSSNLRRKKCRGWDKKIYSSVLFIESYNNATVLIKFGRQG